MSTDISTVNTIWARSRAYLALCKLKVIGLIVFTAFVGMLLAEPGFPRLDILFFATLGIGLASASAAAVNHVVDQELDAIMRRTARRPLPTGQVGEKHALIFATVLMIISMLILTVFVNKLTAVLTFVSLIGYAVVYTAYLKHATPQNIVIGGATGAVPPILGWAAMTNDISPESMLLFLIIFTWTPPHFWALAIHRHQEYAKANIPMLPVTHGIKFTRFHIVLYTILMFLTTLMPYFIGMSGVIYLVGAVILGVIFLYYSASLYFQDIKQSSMRTFIYSVNYLTILFAILLIDHYLKP
jgi:protoheme IX farnesyltransferase